MPALLILQEAAHGGGGETPFSPFSINTGLIFWTLIIFGILLALLWRLGWPVILKSIEERERKIQQQLDDAAKARDEAARLLEEHKRTIANARNEAQEILAKAKAMSQKEREALVAKGHEEQEALLARARREIEAEKDKAIQALRKEAVDLSIAAASKLLETNLDTDTNRRLVMDYLASLEQKH
jgi:F-type H+-transporting ATPase subunit b